MGCKNKDIDVMEVPEVLIGFVSFLVSSSMEIALISANTPITADCAVDAAVQRALLGGHKREPFEQDVKDRGTTASACVAPTSAANYKLKRGIELAHNRGRYTQ